MKSLLKRVWGIYWFVVCGMNFFMVYPFLFLFSHTEKGQNIILLFRSLWLHNLFVLTGIIWRIDRSEAYKEFEKGPINETGVLYCCNHSSFLDIPSLVILRGDIRFMAKVELTKIPFFGRIIRNIDIPVDRYTKRGAYQAYLDGSKALQEKKKIGVFPEGTTSDKAPELLTFKSGPFKMAIENNVPIVPVTFLDNWRRLLNDGKFSGSPGKSRVIAHDPIYPKGYTEVELKDKVFNIINDDLKQAYGS